MNNDKKIEKLLNLLRKESETAAQWKRSYMEDERFYKAGYMEGLREEMDLIIRLFTDDAFFKKYVH